MSDAVIAMRSVPCARACGAAPAMKTAASDGRNCTFHGQNSGVSAVRSLNVAKPVPALALPGSASLNGAHGPAAAHAARHPSHLRRHAAARRRGACRSASASACASSGATARASRRCSRSPPARWRPTAARASRSPAPRSAICAQEPDLAGFATHARLCGGGPRAGRRPASRALSAGAARPDRRGRARAALRRRSAACRARTRARARARHPAARRADQSSRPAGDRMARERTRRRRAPRWC